MGPAEKARMTAILPQTAVYGVASWVAHLGSTGIRKVFDLCR